MKLFVWRGPEVLKNYASGIAIVAAENAEAAFAKLRAEAPGVWLRLSYGNHHSWADDARDVAWIMEQDDFKAEPGFPLQPEEFDLESLPVLYRTGGE